MRPWYTQLTWLAVALAALVAWCDPDVALAAEEEDEKEREVTLDDVPAKVKATILKAAGNNPVKEIEEVILKVFEAEWVQEGKEIEVTVSSEGKLLMKEVEEAEEEEKEGKDDAGKEDDEDEGEEEEKERTIGIDELPAKAKKAILKLAGDHKIQEVEEVEAKFYEAEWTEGNREVEILVAPNGKLVKGNGEKEKKEKGDRGKVREGKKENR